MVNTALVAVIFVDAKLADETNVDATRDDVVTLVENLAPPTISKVAPGEVVLIPTLPPVVKIDPIVLLFPTAVKFVLTSKAPADTLVSIKLVVVILTVVIVPPMTRLPERFILAPVNVVPEIRVEVNVVNVPDVANKLPDVIPLVTLSVPILAFVS